MILKIPSRFFDYRKSFQIYEPFHAQRVASDLRGNKIVPGEYLQHFGGHNFPSRDFWLERRWNWTLWGPDLIPRRRCTIQWQFGTASACLPPPFNEPPPSFSPFCGHISTVGEPFQISIIHEILMRIFGLSLNFTRLGTTFQLLNSKDDHLFRRGAQLDRLNWNENGN